MKRLVILGAGTAGTMVAVKLRPRLAEADMLDGLDGVLNVTDFIELIEGARTMFI